MMSRRDSDTGLTTIPFAPIGKRKRGSCLGEQERRERKRAIDREAQRSLREKTKSHISELERTIQILTDQDKDRATADLLAEIDNLRAKNEQLQDTINSIKSLLGSDIAPRTNTTTEHSTATGGGAVASPTSSSNGMR